MSTFHLTIQTINSHLSTNLFCRSRTSCLTGARETREAIPFIAKLLVAYARVRRFDEKGRGKLEIKNQRGR